MTKVKIPADVKHSLKAFLSSNSNAELVNAYLFYVEKTHKLAPIAYTKEKIIYQSPENLISKLEAEGKLWHEAEIKIGFSNSAVDDHTKKIYICPFTGKVFGDNTHPAPQDAIYDWVSKCPENTERSGGLKVKRFFVSEDPDMIKNYITKRKDPISKIVFSSVASGKLFNSKKAIIDDLVNNQLKPIPLTEVPNQNRFQIEEHFLKFIQDQLEESKISSFIEALSAFKEFSPCIDQWLEEDKEEE